ncbi:unnamed protein product [Rhodiola kirilowii]
MERNGLRGGVFTNLNPGILGLEMPLHQSHHHFQPQQQPAYPSYAVVTQNQKHSDDEEGGMDDNAGADGKRKGSSSPWQRMKWTDGMVRLLIMAVYYIGDECGSESNNNAISSSDAAGKKKAGALMQKKGKWKSVSKAMMEKGFYVSPQQCEDKFNDLNKRYKRVNEILGKGTACRVVENQSLLDQMDHLSVKSKDEVRKLLNSKHLFFREMCAYHNSCGDAAAAVPGHHSPEQSLALPQNLSGNRQIHHHSRINNMDEKQSEDDDSEHEDDDSEHEDDDSEVRCSTKRPREENMRNVEGRTTTSFEMLRVLNEEVAAVMEDETKSGWEKRRWMKMRMVSVEEEKVEKETEAFEMEKERLKWIKYCGNKERDMERKRLRNERGKLECDRMLLLLKHKEMEFDISPSSVTG